MFFFSIVAPQQAPQKPKHKEDFLSIVAPHQALQKT
jgi:hypothetical protein